MKYGAEISTSEVVGAIGEMGGKLDALSLYIREREIHLNVGIIEV